MCISPTTVITRIKEIASRLGPAPIALGRSYELDELATYVCNKKNRIWVAYALDRKRKDIAAIRVGKRSKRTLQPLINTLVLADAKRIQTDALGLYRSMVPEPIHRMKRAGTNGIERMN